MGEEMSDELDLKDCAHCGGRSSFASPDFGYQIYCNNMKCGAMSGIWPTKPMAVRAWNRFDSLAHITAERDGLRIALDLTMLGGNHLANILIQKVGADFSERFPPDMDPQDALRRLCATTEYDVWCCWADIMQARALASTPAVSSEHAQGDT
jgi:hypothetical protein